ncbi:MAG TPA: hypothetical protein VF150_04670, partial [Thermoanaerobaculia bacterium]
EAAGGEVNTDDHPVIEFGFVRNLGRSGLFSIEDLARLARERGEHRPAFRGPAPEAWLLDDARLARGALFGAVPRPPEGDRALGERARLRRAYVDDDWRAVRDGWARQAPGPEEAPAHRVDLLAWAEALAEDGDPRARAAAERLREVTPPEADVVLALLESRQGNDQTAAWYLTQAWERLRENPWAQPGLVRSSFRLGGALARKDQGLAGELYDALAEPFAVAFLDQERRMTRLLISASVDREGACVEAFADLEPWVAWDEQTLSARVTCYEAEDHPRLARARRELAAWRSHEPPSLEHGLPPPAQDEGSQTQRPAVSM